MYSGLSDRGDANEGRDLAEFIRWCRSRGALTIADSHTLTGDPHRLIAEGRPVTEYRLLEPLLPELDVFFTSSDEAKLIENTLGEPRKWTQFDESRNNTHFLEFLTKRYWHNDGRTRLFGVTVSNGAYEVHHCPDGRTDGPTKITSRFLSGEVIDLVGAGDSFRAGLITYLAKNLDAFRAGDIDFAQAVQVGNLFASLFIKAPLDDRYANIKSYDKMLRVLQTDKNFDSFEALRQALN